MPKIIENIRERLLTEAKKQLAENGYAQTTVRSVASACGLGLGTVYNYFKSKDHLIATFMAEDWLALMDGVKKCPSADERAVLKGIFDALTDFLGRYAALFRDRDAAKVFAGVFSERHSLLRSQLSEIILPLCRAASAEKCAFTAEFVAESLLTWTIAGKQFDEQYEIISKLLK